MSSVDAREIVFDMLLELHKSGMPSHLLLQRTLTKYQYLEKRDRAFISHLFKGVIARQITLDAVIGRHAKVKIGKMKPAVRILLRMGSYQLLLMDHVPASAACNETVRLAKRRGLSGLSGFINGVLRSIARDSEEIRYPDAHEDPAGYLSVRYALPLWLVRRLLRTCDFETVARMGAYFLEDRQVTVRVRNAEKTEAISLELIEAGITAEPGRLLPFALRLSGYDHLMAIPAFARGEMVAQDESAMLPALAADPHPGDRILDVCAAPGGKSFQLADMLAACGTGCVTARDLTETKTDRIRENARRLGLGAIRVETRDAAVVCPEDIAAYDIVLADVPCSGLGVMGAKPDIRHNMTEEGIASLRTLQRRILETVQAYVKPGGLLIYSTCTVTPEENEDNVRWLTAHFPFETESMAGILPERLPEEALRQGMLQILPGQYGGDGFFVARLRRKASAE